MKYRLRRFFSGRNGYDQLSKTIIWPSLIIYLASSFVGITWLQYVMYYGALIAIVYALFRVFSRDLDRRQSENGAFLAWKGRLRESRHGRTDRFRQRKTHRFFKCPGCGKFLRVPRGRGRVKVTCRQCGASFEKRT